MAVTDGGISYGCSDALESQAYGISFAARNLARILKNGGTLPKTYTIAGTVYDVVGVSGLVANGTTDNQTVLSNALSKARGGKPTLLVIPPANDFYMHSYRLLFSPNTYLCGYGAKLKGTTVEDICLQVESNCGVFGLLMDTVDAGYSRWPERHESSLNTEPGKQGAVETAAGGGRFYDAHLLAFSHVSNVIFFDVMTRGSIEGVLRCEASNVLVENCSGFRTHSDAFHMIKTCSNSTVRRCHADDVGDDAVSMIQYNTSPGGAQPSNILVEENMNNGNRARGFTTVSSRDVLFRQNIATRACRAGFKASTTNAHSLSPCVAPKFHNNQSWRCSRSHLTGADSSASIALFTSGTHGYGISGVEIKGQKGRSFKGTSPVYDQYEGSHLRQTQNAGPITITANTGNDFATLNQND